MAETLIHSTLFSGEFTWRISVAVRIGEGPWQEELDGADRLRQDPFPRMRSFFSASISSTLTRISRE